MSVVGSRPAGRANDAYKIHLTFFFNAKHRVSFGPVAGPVHGHTWRLETELRTSFRDDPALPPTAFADLEERIRAVLRPYEGRYLNDLPPFDRDVPVTENLARFFFGAAAAALAGTGVEVRRATLWEAPTKGVTVRSALPGAQMPTATALRETSPPTDPLQAPSRGAASPPWSKEEVRAASDRGEGPARPPNEEGSLRLGLLHLLLGAAAILGVAAYAYKPLLLTPPGVAYPWGGDSCGHLFKAFFLVVETAAGNPNPALMPWWYLGVEPFRYWAPLPYYLLGAIRMVSGDILVAGAWLVPLAAVFGGLSWLFFARRLGWAGATAAGAGWTVWPDHIRVALSDGNLPRVVATALLPLLFLTFLDSIERRRWPWSAVAFIALLHLTVLSHAMVAAIACAGLSIFALLYWWLRGVRFRAVARSLSLIVLGLLSSAWWLIPGLLGGITAIDPVAASETAGYAPAAVSFNPMLRLSDPEAFYWGVSSLLLLLAVAVTWRRRTPLSRALFISALLGIVITLPQVRTVYSLLPLSHLLWPRRFTSLAPIALFVSFLSWVRPAQLQPDEDSSRARPTRRVAGLHALLAIVLAVVVLADAWGSLGLVHTRPPQADLEALSRHLAAETPAWRVACLDLGALSSEPSFAFSQAGRREQVFGWAWQGTAIAPGLVRLNTALEQRRYDYVVDRALQFGATDLVVLDGRTDPDRFHTSASNAGFDGPQRFGRLSLYSVAVPPRAFVSPYRVLAIGKLAANLSLLFPSVETGVSALDSYDLATLSTYDTVVLTGVDWRSPKRAEELIRAYVKQGGRVVVDLTRFPKGILNDRPSFLGVSGEPVSLSAMPSLGWGARTLDLAEFADEYDPWVALVPQNLDRVDISFSSYGQPAAVLGYKTVEGGSVAFIGLNLPYHALLTGDLVALDLLAGLLGVEPGAVPSRAGLPLASYQATASGYSFRLAVPQEGAGRAIILPFAAMDSLTVRVDGREVKSFPVENLVGVTLTPGPHAVNLEAGPPPLAGISGLVSLVTGLLIVAYMATARIRVSTRRREAATHLGATRSSD